MAYTRVSPPRDPAAVIAQSHLPPMILRYTPSLEVAAENSRIDRITVYFTRADDRTPRTTLRAHRDGLSVMSLVLDNGQTFMLAADLAKRLGMVLVSTSLVTE